MKIAFEVAIGALLGGLALDGVHYAQPLIREWLESDTDQHMAGKAPANAQNTPTADSNYLVPRPDRPATESWNKQPNKHLGNNYIINESTGKRIDINTSSRNLPDTQ